MEFLQDNMMSKFPSVHHPCQRIVEIFLRCSQWYLFYFSNNVTPMEIFTFLFNSLYMISRKCWRGWWACADCLNLYHEGTFIRVPAFFFIVLYIQGVLKRNSQTICPETVFSKLHPTLITHTTIKSLVSLRGV